MGKKSKKSKGKEPEDMEMEEITVEVGESSAGPATDGETPTTPMTFANIAHLDSSMTLDIGSSSTNLMPELPESSEQEAQEEDEEETEDMYLDDDLVMPDIAEPVTGSFPSDFNVEKYNKKRYGFSFRQYRPSLFDRSVGPLRLPQQIPLDERLLNWENITNAPVDKISLICFCSLGLPHRTIRGLPKALNYYQRTEVLILRDMGLTNVEKINLPNLRLVDLANNNIQDIGTITKMMKNSPNIEILDVSGNPVNQKANLKWKILALLRYINVYNTKQVSPNDKSYAFDQYGTRKQRKANPQMKWDFTFCSLDAIRSMSAWNPDVIVQLYFPNMALDSFSVGTLINLEELDLSSNEITSLKESGLERCNHLRMLDVGNNKIKKKDNLDVLEYIPALTHLVLDGNPMKKYRSEVLFKTHKLLGSNRQRGLLELDNVKVSLEEVIKSIEQHSKLSARETALMRWEHNLVGAFGSFQLHELNNFKNTVQVIRLPRRQLDVAIVDEFPNLRVLDLNNNNLTSVEGLDKCLQLRYLNLSGNANMQVSSIVKQLQNHSSLEHILVTVISSGLGGSKISKNEKKAIQANRQLVLKSLFFNNPSLRRIDGSIISSAEMVNAYATIESNSNLVEQYRFKLAVNNNCTGPKNRQYHYDNVDIGNQYNIEDVKILDKLHHLDLSSDVLRFDVFPELKVLNLRGNSGVASLLTLGFTALPNLRYLDVRDCSIRDTTGDLAELLDAIPKINTFYFKGNPVCQKNYGKARSAIIGAMQEMHNVTCDLRIIDTEVTISERIKAWKKQGASNEEAERLRWQATLHMVRPRDEDGDILPDDQVKGLDLSQRELQYVNITSFVNLEVLLLRGNEFRRVSNVEGLVSCQQLKTLDMRDNKMQHISDVAHIVNELPVLRNLGLDGNRFAQKKDYRLHLLREIERIRSVDCVLTNLDEKEIAIDEIVDAWAAAGGSSSEREIFRFQKNLMRRVPPNSAFGEVQELDLGGANLHYLDFTNLNDLRKLSLADNNLTNSSLQKSNISDLEELQALDLSGNKINDFSYVQTLINNHWKKLNALYIVENGACPENDLDHRVDLLRGLEQMKYTSAPLKILNGETITVAERCKANPGNLSHKNLERFRFALSIEQVGPDAEAEQIILSGFGLKEVADIGSFSFVKYLDLSHNSLTKIGRQHFENLKSLMVLNLSYNELEDESEVLDSLSKCWRLNTLYLQHAFANKQNYAKPSQYLEKVCDELRGLKLLDEVENPNPLTEDQRTVIKYFRKKAPGSVNPNRLFSIDLSDQGLKERDFEDVVAGLTLLPVRNLVMKDNPMFKPQNRLLVLYLVNRGGLKQLDGEEVSESELANAIKKYGKDKDEVNSRFDPKRITQAGEQSGRVRSKSIAGKAATASALADSGVVAKATGSILTKSEILVNFFQIFGLLFLFVPSVAWPRIFINWTFWTFAFTIDFDLLIPFQIPLDWQWAKFAMFMGVPILLLIIYQINPNEEKWRDSYFENWKATRTRGFITLFVWVLISAATAFFSSMDANLADPRFITDTSFSLFVGMAGAGAVLFVLWRWNAGSYRNSVKKKNEEYLFNYKKTKKRICLFALTVMYMPIVKTVLMNFKCNEATNRLERWPDLNCVTGFEDIQIIHWLSIGFGLLYTFGIPGFFVLLIRKGVNDIDRSYKFTDKKERIENMKQKLKDLGKAQAPDEEIEELKKAIDDAEDEFTRDWAYQTKHWSSAQAYLYMPYERHFRFYKTFQMFEKALLLGFSLFAAGVTAVFFGEAVLGAFSLLAYASRPFSDDLEDWMDIVSRTVNLVNMTIGMVITLNLNGLENTIYPMLEPYIESILLGINGLQIVFSVFCFLSQPIRAWIASKELTSKARKLAQAAKKAADAAAEETEEVADSVTNDVDEILRENERSRQLLENTEHMVDATKQYIPGEGELQGVDASANILRNVDYGAVAGDVTVAAGVAGKTISESAKAALRAAPGVANQGLNAAEDYGRQGGALLSSTLANDEVEDTTGIDVGEGIGSSTGGAVNAIRNVDKESAAGMAGAGAGMAAGKVAHNKYAAHSDSAGSSDDDSYLDSEDDIEMAKRIEDYFDEVSSDDDSDSDSD